MAQEHKWVHDQVSTNPKIFFRNKREIQEQTKSKICLDFIIQKKWWNLKNVEHIIKTRWMNKDDAKNIMWWWKNVGMVKRKVL